MTGVVVAFGLAIPNVLSQALLAYREVAGSAGALFGLGYYLLLSLGLAVAASLQDLGLLLGDAVCWHFAAVGVVPRETSAADKAVADAGFSFDQGGLLGCRPAYLPIKR